MRAPPPLLPPAAAAAVTATCTVAVPLPPPPVHVSVNEEVSVNAPVLREPDVATAPFHAPEALQLVALVELQVSVALLPVTTLLAEEVSVTVGAGGATSRLRPYSP